MKETPPDYEDLTYVEYNEDEGELYGFGQGPDGNAFFPISWWEKSIEESFEHEKEEIKKEINRANDLSKILEERKANIDVTLSELSILKLANIYN